VFNNLLKNAVQSIPEGREGRIDVRLQEETGHALATVTDNGSGIPASIHDRIFTPSFTTKSSGMGLGLAMVKRIVEQAGGSVRFESREGEGTTFFVSLPLGA
jgi:signal transduction histidine kinase